MLATVLIIASRSGLFLTQDPLNAEQSAATVSQSSSGDTLDVGDPSHHEFSQYESDRQRREVEGSAYNYDDDEDGDFWSNTDIMPSRIVVPEPSSPIFHSPHTNTAELRRDEATVSYKAPQAPLPDRDRVPTRPDKLSSYYPGMSSYEGSGVGDVIGINSIGDLNQVDLISPTRTEYPSPSSTIQPPPPPSFPPNHQPFISNRLNKLSLIAGKSSRIILPANTFQDLEDGDTRDLNLEIIESKSGEPLNTRDWIQYHPDSQEIVALPLESETGTWKLRVIATDSGGESVVDILEIVVRQHSSSRVFHHSFQLHLTPVNLEMYAHPMVWKIKILKKIFHYFGDKDPSRITVLGIQHNQSGIQFRWTNDTLGLVSCPRQAILSLFRQMKTTTAISPSLIHAFKNDFVVTDVDMQLRGLCAHRTHTTTVGEGVGGGSVGVGGPGGSGGSGGAGVATSGFDNSMPKILNPVDKLNVVAGELLQYQVPEDMCVDPENGKTRYLDLSLLTKQRLEVTSGNWLQFDKKNQEFYGVPLEGDVGREAYQLVCADSQGLMAIDGIEVHVVGRPFYERFNMEFVFVFNETLDDGQRLLNNRVGLLKTISRIFKDPDTRHVVLKNIDPTNFQVIWYNKTVEDQNCPWDWLHKTKRFLLDKDNAPRQHVLLNFAPELHLSDIKMVPQGACVDVPKPEEEEPPGLVFPPGQEYILTFLVPALIIIAMLLFAILIACLLHRKRKGGKLDMLKPETLPPRIPVIMQDELSEDNLNTCKQPIILREEPASISSMTGMGTMGSMSEYQQSSFGKPPNYYGGRMEEEFSESESLVNGSTMPRSHHLSHYSS